MILLVTFLVVVWLVTSNIKWILILLAASMFFFGDCRRRREDAGEQEEPPQATVEVSPTGLPVAQKAYYATEDGELSHERGW